MPALGTRLQVRIHEGALVSRRLAVDIGNKERIDLPAARHRYWL
jgi:hypothetical protein